MSKWSFFILCLLILSGCDSLISSKTSNQSSIREIALSENEEVIFSLLADRIFYFEFQDRTKQFQSIEIGVEYYYYGELVESMGGLKMGANDPELDSGDERVRLLFTIDSNEEGQELLLDGSLRLLFDSGSSGSTDYSFSRDLVERGANSWGYLFEEQEEVILDKKMYSAYFVENIEKDYMRSFDLDVALQPNTDFEHVYLYYIEISEKPLVD
ncbi:hypothetical protein N0O92_06485 [Alkalihalobacillus sp. MEB130]|uniref:hypothetical protein n=1 Tax=Alkalihalobacillus sp. MEB130 TaxID=2976704 RepID=UPI0028DF301A|nr:hypothetical protein [Alkalihalobacillus sp. MEB130]MDT8859875.1 hypothetical protein [Alkalihalobacillus sp. MEB130]